MSEPSAGARAWLSASKSTGLRTKSAALNELRSWMTLESIESNIQRQLTDYIAGITKRTSHPEILSEFLRARGYRCDDNAFSSDVIDDDHVWLFERRSKKWTGVIADYVGEFDVVRPSSGDLESGCEPSWPDDVDPYKLTLNEKDGRFSFEYKHNGSADCWIGNALTNGKQIFLIGFDYMSPDIDASLCIVAPHGNIKYGDDLLVGVQTCILHDDKVATRRIAFVRTSPCGPDADLKQLRSAARNWVTASSAAERGLVLRLSPSTEIHQRD